MALRAGTRAIETHRPSACSPKGDDEAHLTPPCAALRRSVAGPANHAQLFELTRRFAARMQDPGLTPVEQQAMARAYEAVMGLNRRHEHDPHAPKLTLKELVAQYNAHLEGAQ